MKLRVEGKFSETVGLGGPNQFYLWVIIGWLKLCNVVVGAFR